MLSHVQKSGKNENMVRIYETIICIEILYLTSSIYVQNILVVIGFRQNKENQIYFRFSEFLDRNELMI